MSLANWRAFFAAITSTAATEKGKWKVSAMDANTQPSAFQTRTPTPARWISRNTAPSKFTLSFGHGGGFQIDRRSLWGICSGGQGGMVQTNDDLAFCTSEKTCWIGICLPLVSIMFLRFQIAHTVVAKRFKSFPYSMMVSTKSWKLEKRGMEIELSCILLWDHAWEMEGHDQSAWSTSSDSPSQWSQPSSVSTIRRQRLCFVGIEFLMALHKKFQTLGWTCIPHTFFHNLLSSGWYSPLSKHLAL